MVTTPSPNTMTKIRLTWLDDGAPGLVPGQGTAHPPGQGETLWAEGIPDRLGHYALRNNAFGASLRLHDVVRTELNGLGYHQVVDVVDLHPGPVTLVQLPEGADDEQVQRVADSWRRLGAEYTEGAGGGLITAWVAGATPQSVCEVLAATAPRWRILDVATAPVRRMRVARELDFRLDRRTPADLTAEHTAMGDGETRPDCLEEGA
ncbi:hypothetical protein [Serinibacter salmoneus]|uniref:Uncharacterized protein n=1 Tax=Serinibacter salmoneus TaxID=556530 RepID=A0A2A9D5U3_9MICO|nr:hypothetical protein [Serinibacter salmoneus]PFG21210.1 hypothetical protein ATL40_2833 [Serinibacter salmoneus]